LDEYAELKLEEEFRRGKCRACDRILGLILGGVNRIERFILGLRCIASSHEEAMRYKIKNPDKTEVLPGLISFSSEKN
jgi:hypothetical protein